MWLKETEKILDLLSREEKLKGFVFVGGSALSYYLSHRLSEDIDLFCIDKELKQMTINNILEKFYSRKHSIIKLTTEDPSIQLDYKIDNIKVTFLAWSLNALKTESTPFKRNLRIVSLDLLSGMKAYVFGRRIEIRDAYDLYALSHEYGLGKIIDSAKKFFGDLFSERMFINQISDLSRFSEVKIEDYLNPKYDVSKKDIEDYFILEVEKYVVENVRKLNTHTKQAFKIN